MKTRPLGDFHKNKSTGDGYQQWCKHCIIAHRKGEKVHSPHDPECRCKGCVAKINAIDGQKYCKRCDQIKPRRDFSGASVYCRACCRVIKSAMHHSQAPEERKKSNLKRRLARYQLTIDDFENMFAKQGGMCAAGIHPMTRDDAQVDHDHSCCPHVNNGNTCGNCTRALLCGNCNSALGMINDNMDRALALATYLAGFQNALSMEWGTSWR